MEKNPVPDYKRRKLSLKKTISSISHMERKAETVVIQDEPYGWVIVAVSFIVQLLGELALISKIWAGILKTIWNHSLIIVLKFSVWFRIFGILDKDKWTGIFDSFCNLNQMSHILGFENIAGEIFY